MDGKYSQERSSLEQTPSWTVLFINYLQPKINGGLLKYLAESPAPDAISDSKVYVNWVSHSSSIAFFNIFLFTTALIPILFLISSILRLCYRINRNRKQTDFPVKQKSCLNRVFRGRRCCVKTKDLDRISRRRNQLIYSSACFGICTVIIICAFVGFYFSAVGKYEMERFVMGDSSNQSVRLSLNRAVKHVEIFVTEQIIFANTTMLPFVKEFEKYLIILLGDMTTDFIGRLLYSVGINNTFLLTDQLLGGLANMTETMRNIDSSRKTLFTEIDSFRGSVKGFARPQLEQELPKVCKQSVLPPDVLPECRRLYNQSRLLEDELDESKIDFDASTTVTVFLSAAQIDISRIRQNFLEAKNALSKIVSSMKSEMLTKLPVGKLFDDLPTMWKIVDQELTKNVVIPLKEFQKSDSTKAYVSILDKYIKILFYLSWIITLAFCFLVIFMLFWCGIAKCILRCNTPPSVVHEIQFEFLIGSITTSQVQVSNASKFKKRLLHYQREILRYIEVLHIGAGFALLIPLVICICLVFVCGLYMNEVCRYAIDDKAMVTGDPFADQLIQKQIDKIMANVNLKSLDIPIIVKKPEHVLNALYSTCARENASLLYALNMVGMLNASALPETSIYKNATASGRLHIQQEIRKLEIGTLMPASMFSYLKDAEQFVKLFSNSTDLAKSIAALREPMFRLGDYAQFVTNLELIFSRSSDETVTSLKSYLQSQNWLQNSVSKYTQLRIRILAMIKDFENLQRSRTLSETLVTLEESIRTTKDSLNNSTRLSSMVDRLYTVVMSTFAGKLVDEIGLRYRHLERHLLKCQSLHKAYVEVMWAACSRFSSDLSFLSLWLSVTTLLTVIIYIVSCLLLKFEMGMHEK